MFPNRPVLRSLAKAIGASAYAVPCHTNAAVSCLAASCYWSDNGLACFLLVKWQAANMAASCLDYHLDTI